jgi:hypothetical protein
MLYSDETGAIPRDLLSQAVYPADAGTGTGLHPANVGSNCAQNARF